MVAAEHVGEAAVPEPGLRIGTRSDGAWAVVSFAGDLDLAGMTAADEAVIAAIGNGAEGVLIDLTGVTFIGSEGIRLLLRAQEAGEGAGRPVRILAGEGAARRLIELVGLSERLGIDGSPG